MSSLGDDFSEKELHSGSDPVRPHVIEPAFTIIDDRFPEKGEEVKQEKASEKKSVMSARFLCFLGLIFCSIFGLGMLLMSIVSTAISIGTLFRNKNVVQSMVHFWKLTIHTTVAGIGCILGLISPALGLGLIALYFSITGQTIDNQFLDSVIKRSFNS